MENLLKRNAVYLLLYYSVFFLICFHVEVFYFEWGAFWNYKSNQIIIATIWILITFITIYLLLKKIGISPKSFFAHCVIFGSFIFTVGLILSFIIGSNRSYIIETKYIGTSGVIVEENYDGDGADTRYENTYVFHKKDKALEREVAKLDEKYSDGSSTENFIFWQTALAKGFEPKNIRDYICCDDFSKKLELYLTVGPLTILECIIKAMYTAFLLLMFPLTGLLFKKHLFFSDMNGLRRIYKKLE